MPPEGLRNPASQRYVRRGAWVYMAEVPTDTSGRPSMRRRHPKRSSMRLEGHDYRLPRWYFVTANTWKRAHWFGAVERGRMVLNQAGKVVAEEWHRTGELRDNVRLDAFVVMPNHFHGILRLVKSRTQDSGAHRPPAKEGGDFREFGTAVPNSLSTIIGCMKASVTRRLHRHPSWRHRRIWQPRFHDRILRGRRELKRARLYIRKNPQRWRGG